jgi:hypothetical protein
LTLLCGAPHTGRGSNCAASPVSSPSSSSSILFPAAVRALATNEDASLSATLAPAGAVLAASSAATAPSPPAAAALLVGASRIRCLLPVTARGPDAFCCCLGRGRASGPDCRCSSCCVDVLGWGGACGRPCAAGLSAA